MKVVVMFLVMSIYENELVEVDDISQFGFLEAS